MTTVDHRASGKPSGRLADGVYSTLLNQLISGEIRPGERITVDGVSRDLQVSQTPVREALTRLESDGLVAKIHLIGYRATPQLNRDQFENLFEMRLLLETHTAAKAAKEHTPQQREAMLKSAEKMARLAARIHPPTYGNFALEDARLHDLIAASGNNEFVRDALTRMHSHVHLFRLRFDTRVPLDACEEHQVLIDAIVAGDASAARSAMRQHLTRSRIRLRAWFTEQSSLRGDSAQAIARR